MAHFHGPQSRSPLAEGSVTPTCEMEDVTTWLVLSKHLLVK